MHHTPSQGAEIELGVYSLTDGSAGDTLAQRIHDIVDYGVAADQAGLLLYFLGALGFHLRVKDFKGLPRPTVFTVLSAAALFPGVTSASPAPTNQQDAWVSALPRPAGASR